MARRQHTVPVQPPVARYALSASAKLEFSQIVARNQRRTLYGSDLKQQVRALDSSRFEIPSTFTMYNFEQHKKAGDEWTSEPFYTAPLGYKLNLSVYANGNRNGAGTHVSVYLQLMPGESDGRLRWPFRGSFVVKLLDQSGNGRDIQQSISFDDKTPEDVARRPTSKENTGWGEPTFVSLRQLYPQSQYSQVYWPQYIKDGCIRFQVMSCQLQPPVACYALSASAKRELSQIIARNQCGLLFGGDLKQQIRALDSSRFETPATFMMYNFEQHKRAGDEWTSEPFYTAPIGYKLNLSVYANGNRNGAGTHVSVYLQLMPGEFDGRLRWPFRGSFVVKLLDQSSNGRDIQQSISFGYGTPEDVAKRPTYKENTGWGEPTFVSLPQLYPRSQYPYTGTPQYIKDGCIQFQVIAV